jgi:ubiquitin-like 1-activating enzyme E1 B
VYPYCTIRSTPEKPVHCLVWAKNLFDLCFGPEDESNLLSDLLADMKEMQGAGGATGADIGKKIFGHLFDADIQKQAGLEDLWSDKRPPPTPLVFDQASKDESGGQEKGSEDLLSTQRVPTHSGDAKGFVAAVEKMYSPESKDMLGQSVFSKDNPIAMDFVHCAANLRMQNYRIDRLSRWDAQSIAGAIIPAVASTNAIVAGLEVVQLIHILTAPAGNLREKSDARTVWVRYPEPIYRKILQPSTLQAPNKDCLVCGSRMARVSVKSLADWKIAAFVKACMQGALGAHRPAVYFNSGCIFDPDYPEASEEAEEEGLHPDWTLKEWDLVTGSILQVEDEGQGFSCNLCLQEDAELSEELFPAGFSIQGGAEEFKEEAANDNKRKAEEDAAAAADKKAKLDADEIAIEG